MEESKDEWVGIMRKDRSKCRYQERVMVVEKGFISDNIESDFREERE